MKEFIFYFYLVIWLLSLGMIFGKWGQEKKVLKSGVGDVVSAIISLLLVLAIYGVWG